MRDFGRRTLGGTFLALPGRTLAVLSGWTCVALIAGPLAVLRGGALVARPAGTLRALLRARMRTLARTR